MIFLNINQNVQKARNACDCVKLVIKIDKFCSLKLDLYTYCLQYTLYTCTYVCISRASLNVSSKLCNMCQPFCKSPLFCKIKVSIVLIQSSMYRGDRTKWYRQNGMRTKWHEQNSTILYFAYILIQLNSIYI